LRVHSSRFFAIFLLVFVLATTAFSQGEIRQADDWLVKSPQHRSLDSLKDKLGYPDPPIDQGLVVLLTAGGATANILIVGPVKGDAKAYAEALNAWQAEFGGKETVLFSQEDDCAAARISWSSAQFLNLRTDRTYDTASLLRRLEKVASPVRTAIRIPNYARSYGLGEPSYTTSTASVYEIKSVVKPTRVVVELPDHTPAFFWLFVLFVPTLCIGGLLAAVAVGSAKSMPVEKRRKLYSKLALYPTFGAIAIHAPFAFYLLTSRKLTPMADLWFGTTSTATAFFPLILGPVFLVTIAAGLNTKVEKHLFGPSEGEAETLPPVPEPSEEKKAYELRLKHVTWGIMAIAGVVWLGSMFMPRPRSEWQLLARTGGMVTFLFAGQIARLVLKREAVKFEGELEDPELETLARRVGDQMGVPVRSVRIIRNPLEAAGIKALFSARNGNLRVTEKARQTMDPSEIEFLIARELAAVRLRHAQKRLIRNLPVLIALLPMFYIGIQIANPGLPALPLRLTFILPLVGMMYILLTGFSFSRREETEKDREALLVTRDLPAAVAAVWKMQMSTPMPHMDEVVSKHPQIAERLAALRAVRLD
jgi:Zn-dependent protease with chaperone function